VESRFELSGGVVVPLGIDPDILETPAAPYDERRRHPYVLAISRLHPKKQFELLIDAFADAAADRPEWTLTIAGDGDPAYVAALQHRASESAARGAVRFVGWVDGERKRDLLRHASLVALCSKHENFGLAILEGLAAGVPALVTRDVDFAADIERAGAGWVAAAERGPMAECLRAVFTEAEDGERRALAARVLAARFAWPRVGAELAALYDRLVRTTRAGAVDPVATAATGSEYTTVRLP